MSEFGARKLKQRTETNKNEFLHAAIEGKTVGRTKNKLRVVEEEEEEEEANVKIVEKAIYGKKVHVAWCEHKRNRI